MDIFVLISFASILIIISYFFQVLARKTNIPSVLMLMATGVAAQFVVPAKIPHLQTILGILGNVGLILIVLEASLDLRIRRDKIKLILKATASALLGILALGAIITLIIQYLYPAQSWVQAGLYAVPFAVMSSAIVIPSVGSLSENPKEFMIYESAISDILGIILFYLFIDLNKGVNSHQVVFGISILQLIGTLIIGIILSYGLIWVFSRIKEKTKLFLIIAALLLLFAVGKIFHVSSLIIIMIFGLILGNLNIFFRGRIAKFIDFYSGNLIMKELHHITLESAFVIKTFFFFFFGLSINLPALSNIHAWAFAIGVLMATYLVRYWILKAVRIKDFKLLTYITPRGLISILLFFSIPAIYAIQTVDESGLLILIIVTNIIMTIGLVRNGKQNESDNKKVNLELEHPSFIPYVGPVKSDLSYFSDIQAPTPNFKMDEPILLDEDSNDQDKESQNNNQ